MPERPRVYMDIHSLSIGTLRVDTSCWSSELALRAAIDRLRVQVYPIAVDTQCLDSASVKGSACGGADIHQQVAATGNGVDQHLDQLLGALPGRFVPMVSP